MKRRETLALNIIEERNKKISLRLIEVQKKSCLLYDTFKAGAARATLYIFILSKEEQNVNLQISHS